METPNQALVTPREGASYKGKNYDNPFIDESGGEVESGRRLTLNCSDDEADDDDDDEDEGEDDDDDDDDDDEQRQQQQKEKRVSPHPPSRQRPPRPSALVPRSSLVPSSVRRRRRSSARFLKFGSSAPGSSASSGERSSTGRAGGVRQHSRKSLALIYNTEIKMNAENRINSANSWNFKLIENLDRLLTEVDDEDDDEKEANNSQRKPRRDPAEPGRVDFTRASCSIDASVRIYGYRVDDVHLTSYKVLANLHRSDTNHKAKKGKKGGNEDDAVGQGDDVAEDKDAAAKGGAVRKSKKSSSAGPTLESNLANINLSKLDSAYDIDPLFHKMSKTFDEGGAKGLLLANLGTGSDGCNIIFDTLIDGEDDKKEEEGKAETDDDTNQKMCDISVLHNKLEVALDGQPLSAFSLVHQLSGLRVDFSQLYEQGYVDPEVPMSRTQRYAPESEEEAEADRSIHQEALERSRASLGRSFAFADDSGRESTSPGAVNLACGDDSCSHDNDFGGYDDGGGYDDDYGETFMPDDNEYGNGGVGRVSSFSFSGPHQGGRPTEEQKQTATVLDVISSGQLLGDSQYEYLNRQALSQVTHNNAWVGAAHWRPAKKPKKAQADVDEKPKKEKRSKKEAKERKFVDLTITPDMTDILRVPPKPRGKNKANPLQFSNAVVAKCTSCDNLLPPDATLGVRAFSSLFLRPNTIVNVKKTSEGGIPTTARKSVMWDLDQVQRIDGGVWDEGSFGGGGGGDDDYDDGGAGFDFSGGGGDEDEEPDFVAEGMDEIRRVEKIKIGYATVAKKVDVKRLKQDLWSEIELNFKCLHEETSAKNVEKDDKNNANESEENKNETASVETASRSNRPLSFNDVVQKMEQDKKQPDVSLPYYFICILHLANEKNLRLVHQGLEDFLIYQDDGAGEAGDDLDLDDNEDVNEH